MIDFVRHAKVERNEYNKKAVLVTDKSLQELSSYSFVFNRSIFV